MRPLTDRQAISCEHAQSRRCRCRCGGALHGAARVGDRSQLPSGDPHGPGSGQIPLDSTVDYPSDATIAAATKALREHLATPVAVSLTGALRASVAATKQQTDDETCAAAGHPLRDDGLCACGLVYDPERFAPEDDGEDEEAYQ